MYRLVWTSEKDEEYITHDIVTESRKTMFHVFQTSVKIGEFYSLYRENKLIGEGYRKH